MYYIVFGILYAVSLLPFRALYVISDLLYFVLYFVVGYRKKVVMDNLLVAFPEKTENPNGWVSPWRFGLNQGPIVIMIENYNTELVWKIMKQCPYILKGLQEAGFTGGWLENLLDPTPS